METRCRNNRKSSTGRGAKMKDLACGTKLSKEHWGALHKWFKLIAEALNDGGLTLKPFLEKVDYRMDIPWTDTMVKEVLYKPILERQTNKESTTKMTPRQALEVEKALEWWLSTHTGVYVEFPHEEKKNES